jgi:hypothetical protein
LGPVNNCTYPEDIKKRKRGIFRCCCTYLTIY